MGVVPPEALTGASLRIVQASRDSLTFSIPGLGLTGTYIDDELRMEVKSFRIIWRSPCCAAFLCWAPDRRVAQCERCRREERDYFPYCDLVEDLTEFFEAAILARSGTLSLGLSVLEAAVGAASLRDELQRVALATLGNWPGATP